MQLKKFYSKGLKNENNRYKVAANSQHSQRSPAKTPNNRRTGIYLAKLNHLKSLSIFSNTGYVKKYFLKKKKFIYFVKKPEYVSKKSLNSFKKFNLFFNFFYFYLTSRSLIKTQIRSTKFIILKTTLKHVPTKCNNFRQNPFSNALPNFANNSTNLFSNFVFSYFKKKKFNFFFLNQPNYDLISKHQISANFKIKMLKFYSKYKTPFLLPTGGFLLKNSITHFFNLTKLQVYKIRKKQFSFSHKNNLQNYIIKKYFKNKLVPSDNLSFKSILRQTPKPFVFFNNHRHNFLNSQLNSTVPLRTNLFNTSVSQNLTPVKHSNVNLFSGLPKQKNWSQERVTSAHLDGFYKLFTDPVLGRVKLKPGYSIIWRKARKLLQTELGLKFQYQHRLTRFLIKYYKFSSFNFFFYNEMMFKNILLKSSFFPDLATCALFFNNNLIWLNGAVCRNFEIALLTGDFIQLIVHNKYYILYRWINHSFYQKRLKLKNKIYTKIQKQKNQRSYEDKQRSSVLPKWVWHNKIFLFDVPHYLEVDYFTLSVCLLYEPFTWADVDPYHFINTRTSALNMYNWKYLN